MRQQHEGFEIDDDLESIDFDVVHQWLTSTYWSPGISREKVERAAYGSATVIGAYVEGILVGYARVVSDKTTFAWLCDVYVDTAFRGRGVAKAMVRFALDLPYSSELRRWVLATRDAHSIYAECGFTVLENPGRWMLKRIQDGIWFLRSVRSGCSRASHKFRRQLEWERSCNALT